MVFEFNGLDKLQSDVEQVNKIFSSLGEQISTLKFDSLEPSAVEFSLATLDLSLDERLASFNGNKIIAELTMQMKQEYRLLILEHIRTLRLEKLDPNMNQESIFGALNQIDDIVIDLCRSNDQTFDRHIKRLSKHLHSECVSQFSNELEINANVDDFLEKSEATEGSMVGSAKLLWPEDDGEQIGLVLTLIDRFSKDENFVVNFSFTYFPVGTNISTTLRNMVNQIIVPFARDYKKFVIKRSGVQMDDGNTMKTMNQNNHFTINNSTIGAVQTGEQAIANIALQSNKNDAEGLLRALDLVAEALSKMEDIQGHKKGDILELVQDGKAELVKPAPNISRLTSYLKTVGETVSAIESLKPIYDALKIGANAIGIQIP